MLVVKLIVTGGPGVGKSTLLDKLARKGYETVPEAARAIIDEQLSLSQSSSHNPILPWTDLERFQVLVREKQIQNESRYRGKKTFLDRSLVDQYAYASLGGFDLGKVHDERVKEAGYSKVFLLEPLQQYKSDIARRENHDQAARIHEKIWEAYDKRGFNIIPVPVFAHGDDPLAIALNLEERLAFIERAIKLDKNREKESKSRAAHTPQLRSLLTSYQAYQEAHEEQRDAYFDVKGFLASKGYALRVRFAGKSSVTLKGPDRGEEMFDRLELQLPLPAALAGLLHQLPAVDRVTKFRSTYKPLHSPQVALQLDRLLDGREYVEIEAPSMREVSDWRRRLDLPPSERTSYQGIITQAA